MTRKRGFILIALLLLAAAFITILNYSREAKVDKRELMRGVWRSTGAGPELSITKDSDGYWLRISRSLPSGSTEVEDFELHVTDFGGVRFVNGEDTVYLFHKPGTDRMLVLPGYGSYQRKQQ